MTPAPSSNSACPGVSGPVLDMQQLLERCMGSQELADRCLLRFAQKLRAEVESVQQGVTNENLEELVQLAHRLKGSAATVSAVGLAKAAAAMEDYARGKTPAEPTVLFGEFQREVERFFDAVPELSQVG